jgi:hypothetical protein
MVCVFCFANFEFNTIKCNTVISLGNKTVGMFFISLINVMNILKRIID